MKFILSFFIYLMSFCSIASGFVSIVVSNDIINIVGEKTEEWTEYVNIGNSYDCTTWNPSANTIKKGIAFEQSRDCKQDQKRERNIYEELSDGTKRLKKVEIEEKTVNSEEKKQAIGTKVTYTYAWVAYSTGHCNYSTVNPPMYTCGQSRVGHARSVCYKTTIGQFTRYTLKNEMCNAIPQ